MLLVPGLWRLTLDVMELMIEGTETEIQVIMKVSDRQVGRRGGEVSKLRQICNYEAKEKKNERRKLRKRENIGEITKKK